METDIQWRAADGGTGECEYCKRVSYCSTTCTLHRKRLEAAIDMGLPLDLIGATPEMLEYYGIEPKEQKNDEV